MHGPLGKQRSKDEHVAQLSRPGPLGQPIIPAGVGPALPSAGAVATSPALTMPAVISTVAAANSHQTSSANASLLNQRIP